MRRSKGGGKGGGVRENTFVNIFVQHLVTEKVITFSLHQELRGMGRFKPLPLE
jgi:hypothetical protein